jgi:hypothetical protein
MFEEDVKENDLDQGLECSRCLAEEMVDWFDEAHFFHVLN